jgi:CHASE2 domain-containing sensor protein
MPRRTLAWVGAGLVATGLAAGAVALLLHGTAATGWLEQHSIDVRFALRGDRAPSRDVVVVALDATSLRHVPRPPIPRSIDARVIERLHRAGARVIAFDFTLQRQTSRAADLAVVAALQRARPAVVAVADERRDHRLDPIAGRAAFGRGVVPGATLLFPDSDGTIRDFPRSLGRVPAFGVAAGHALHPSVSARGSARALIDYPGPAGTVKQIAFADVRSGLFAPRDVRGKIVVIGPTAPALQDIHPTPVDATMPGPEIQAAAISTALAGFPLRRSSGTETTWTLLALGFVLPLLLTLTLVRRRRAAGHADGVSYAGPRTMTVVLAAVVVVLAWSVVAQISFDSGDVVDYVDGVVAVAAGAIFVGLGTAWAERRERARLRRLFAADAPAVVAAVLEEPNRSAVGPTDVIAGYRIEREIGRGGMGVVYRASQLHLDRPVALKLIRPEFADDPLYRSRFVRESRVAASLSHPNIIPVFDAGDDAGLLYISMLYVDGVDVARELQLVGTLQPSAAVLLLDQVAGALDAAHAAGLVHRDVKPANIVVPTVNREHAFLTDFGLARPVREELDAPRERGAGTIDYLAPEQLGDGTIDHRVDIYALAAVLYHCLTGVVPFPRATDEAKMTALAHDSRPSATRHQPALPSAVDAVIARGMAIDPQDRYASATQLTEAARHALGIGRDVAASDWVVSASGDPLGVDDPTRDRRNTDT